MEAPGNHFYYINTFGVSWDKSNASLFPLKPSLSCPGSWIEGLPSNSLNPEVIAAGSFPTWLYSNLANTQVGSLRRQYTNPRLKLSLRPGVCEEGLKYNNFIYLTAFSTTVLRGRNGLQSGGCGGDEWGASLLPCQRSITAESWVCSAGGFEGERRSVCLWGWWNSFTHGDKTLIKWNNRRRIEERMNVNNQLKRVRLKWGLWKHVSAL